MTDLPRRAYPLVVPPPGGFEQAVRRGRRIRRRRAGGGTGAALLLVGALTYSIIGHGTGTSSLHSTHQPPPGAPAIRAAQSTPTPAPQVTASGIPPTGAPGSSAPGTPGGRPGASVAPRPDASPTIRTPGAPGPVYARRNAITVSAPFANTQTQCLMDASTPDWCSYANVSGNSSAGTYTLEYTLCRNVNAGDGPLTFDRGQHADFSAVDTTHNDTVWTYSAGQSVVHSRGSDDIPGGYCKTWSVVWDGYDDFSATPPAGPYRLVARSLATGTYPTATFAFTHD